VIPIAFASEEANTSKFEKSAHVGFDTVAESQWVLMHWSVVSFRAAGAHRRGHVHAIDSSLPGPTPEAFGQIGCLQVGIGHATSNDPMTFHESILRLLAWQRGLHTDSLTVKEVTNVPMKEFGIEITLDALDSVAATHVNPRHPQCIHDDGAF